MIYAIYHSADLDGITCGALAKIKFPYIHLIGYDYGQPLDEILAIPDGSEVYMMDVSLPKDKMEELGRRVNLTWIDHHKSAMLEIMRSESNQQLNYHLYLYNDGKNYKSIRCYCEVGRAACELAMEFFELGEEIHSMAVRHLGMYDTWRKHDDWWTTLKFQFGMRSLIGLDVDKMINFLTLKRQRLFFDAVNLGKHIINYQRDQAAIIMKNSFECIMRVGEDKYPCIAVNSMGLNFDLLPDHYDFTGKVFLQYIHQGGHWKLSMRSIGDLDVCEICTKLGGGGHKNAAGVVMSDNLVCAARGLSIWDGFTSFGVDLAYA